MLTKWELIRKILENDVYQPDSGLSQLAFDGLSKLSRVALANLLLIIELKDKS